MFHAGWVDWTCDISHGSKSRVKRVWICILVGWMVLGPSYFSKDVFSVFFIGIVYSIYVVCARKTRKRPQPTHPHLAVPVALGPRVDPTSEIVICAVSGPSSLAEPPPAASPQLGRWISQHRLRSARTRCLLLVLLRRRLLLPFTFDYISYWYHNSYRIRTWVLKLPCVVFVVAHCNAARMCGRTCFGGL